MADKRDSLRDPSRRTVLGAGTVLLGAMSGGMATPGKAELAQLRLPAKAPEAPPPGYNVLFVRVDQEHFFEKWPFPVPGREYLKKYGAPATSRLEGSAMR